MNTYCFTILHILSLSLIEKKIIIIIHIPSFGQIIFELLLFDDTSIIYSDQTTYTSCWIVKQWVVFINIYYNLSVSMTETAERWCICIAWMLSKARIGAESRFFQVFYDLELQAKHFLLWLVQEHGELVNWTRNKWLLDILSLKN